jgi:hypothetical protein
MTNLSRNMNISFPFRQQNATSCPTSSANLDSSDEVEPEPVGEQRKRGGENLRMERRSPSRRTGDSHQLCAGSETGAPIRRGGARRSGGGGSQNGRLAISPPASR